MEHGLGIMMKKVMKIGLGLCFILPVGLSLIGCSYNNPADAVNDVIKYYTKEVMLSSWADVDADDDDEKTCWGEVEMRLYDEQGELAVVSVNTWSEMDDIGNFMITRTDVYEVDDDGEYELSEYYIYDYLKDDYEYVDDDGVTQSAIDYLFLRGKTYSSDDVLRYYYYMTYDDTAVDEVSEVSDTAGDSEIDDDNDTDNAYYTSIINKRTSDGESIAEQYCDWVEDPDGDKKFRTEKYYTRNTADDDILLSAEYACWYEVSSPYYYQYELYHSFRGEPDGDDASTADVDESEEFYYFTRFSRNAAGYVYEQADYNYSFDNTDLTIALVDGSFKNNDADLGWATGTFHYSLDFDSIGVQETVLMTEYDAAGNCTLDKQMYKGELVEYTEYTYNSDSELTDEVRYTEGGSLTYEQTTIRFNDETLYGKDYSLKTTCEYKYYDNDSSDWDSDTYDFNSRTAGKMMRSTDSFYGLNETEMKHIRYSRFNNNYRR